MHRGEAYWTSTFNFDVTFTWCVGKKNAYSNWKSVTVSDKVTQGHLGWTNYNRNVTVHQFSLALNRMSCGFLPAFSWTILRMGWTMSDCPCLTDFLIRLVVLSEMLSLPEMLSFLKCCLPWNVIFPWNAIFPWNFISSLKCYFFPEMLFLPWNVIYSLKCCLPWDVISPWNVVFLKMLSSRKCCLPLKCSLLL